MNDLNALLDRAAGPPTVRVDAHADLARGQQALARTRRRRVSAGLLGVAAAGVVGVGLARYPDADRGATHTTAEHRTEDAGVTLLAQPFEAGPYSFDSTPQGWEVQGSYPQGVTIAPVGYADQEPLSFLGKLVIMFDQNPPGRGEELQHAGRTYWVSDNGGDHITISTVTRPNEPQGVVRVQYPSGTGWTRDTMLEFLAGVHVGADARPGVG
jgi:hypothetical protein